ncbi:MAG: hypothetical protein KAH05_00605, partial [Clostridiales bacterium]|nr:hypothetical protein [Clostridiales bacterium]
MNSIRYAKKKKSFLAKLLVVLMVFTICIPSMPVHAGVNDVTAYGFGIDAKYQGKWTTGNLGKTYEEGEWVAFQTEIRNINWSETDPNGLFKIGVEFDFYDIGRYFDLVRNVSVGLELLPNTHGFPAAGLSMTEPSPGGAMPLGDKTEVNVAQRDPNNPYEHYFDGFALINKTINITSQMNIAMDDGTDTDTDATRKFCIEVDQIKKAYWDEYGIDITESNNKIVLYFQLHLSRTWLWNNESDFGDPIDYETLAYVYTQQPTDKWGGYVYDENFLTQMMLGSSVYPGSSGHSYVHVITNDGQEAGKKTIPIPNVEETTGSISGYKFTDVDGNEEYDEGVDIPLEGWNIYLRTDL